MCPHCHKTCCKRCITKWIRRKKECPNCRGKIHLSQLKKNGMIEEIIQTQNNPLAKEKKAEIACVTHSEDICMRWLDCNKDLCPGCLDDDEHMGHKIRSIKSIYSSAKEKAVEEQKSLEQYLEQLNEDEEKINQSINTKVTSIKTTTEMVTEKITKFMNHQVDRIKE